VRSEGDAERMKGRDGQERRTGIKEEEDICHHHYKEGRETLFEVLLVHLKCSLLVLLHFSSRFFSPSIAKMFELLICLSIKKFFLLKLAILVLPHEKSPPDDIFSCHLV
jgi:hypothetical protein